MMRDEIVHKDRVRTMGGVALALVAALPLAACGGTSEVDQTSGAKTALTAPVNGDWITIDGIVASKFPGEFVLNYGAGTIGVEMDDWDKTLEGVSLLPGDKVSVTGRVDNDLFEKASIEASSVYVHNLNTVFYASGADEEDLPLRAVPETTLDSGVDYTGWVTGSWEKGFSLGAGPMLVRVDTTDVKTPLARTGIGAGDRVYVWGDLDFRKGQSVLVADGLMRLVDGGIPGEVTTSSNGKRTTKQDQGVESNAAEMNTQPETTNAGET